MRGKELRGINAGVYPGFCYSNKNGWIYFRPPTHSLARQSEIIPSNMYAFRPNSNSLDCVYRITSDITPILIISARFLLSPLSPIPPSKPNTPPSLSGIGTYSSTSCMLATHQFPSYGCPVMSASPAKKVWTSSKVPFVNLLGSNLSLSYRTYIQSVKKCSPTNGTWSILPYPRRTLSITLYNPESSY